MLNYGIWVSLFPCVGVEVITEGDQRSTSDEVSLVNFPLFPGPVKDWHDRILSIRTILGGRSGNRMHLGARPSPLLPDETMTICVFLEACVMIFGLDSSTLERS